MTLQTTLAFECVCQDGSVPPLEKYLQTIPTFTCQQAYSDCIQRNVGNLDGQNKCKTDIQDNCGTLDPNPATTTKSSSPTGAPTSTGGTNSVTTTTRAGAAATAGAYLGNGAAAVAIGVLAYLV
jgi:hypothetical protein